MKKIAKRIELVDVFIVAVILLILGLLIYGFSTDHSTALDSQAQGPDTKLPSFAEIQQMLVKKGYPIEVDGRIGPATLRAWESELCNQQASRMFKMMKGESK